MLSLLCVLIVGGMIVINMEKPSLEDLTHYGVKGMRWGHHKRPDTVEIVDARAAMEKEKASFKKAQKLYNKQTAYGLLGATEKEQKVFDLATREYEYKKEDLGKAKILNKLKSKPKSEEQLKLEAKYKKEKKMTDDEAAVAAYQHIKTKKMLMVIGGLAVTAGVAYAGYKLHDARVDKIFKAGTMLQHMSADSSIGVRDAFYSAENNLDKIKYRGMFGTHLDMNFGGAYKKEIKVLSDIKQASPKNAHSILTELVSNDPSFANDLKKYIRPDNVASAGYVRQTKLAEKALAKGVVDKNVYEIFNVALVDHSPEMQSLADRYFKTLADKGYNAIRDVNDVKYSGYNAINPIIAFNTQGKVSVVDVAKLTKDQLKKEGALGRTLALGETVGKQGSVLATSMIAGPFGQKIITQKINQKAIDKYRQENPNTTMTNTEIIRMIERSKR